MKYQICLSKKVIIFYSLLSPFIIYGSFYNLMNVINGTGSVISLGAFGLGGFILLPLLIITSYRRNLCKVYEDALQIGKVKYSFSSYDFSIHPYQLPFKDRPLTSLFKSEYHELIIKKKGNKEIVFQEKLEIFEKDIEKLQQSLPKF